jgi:hypothetical protein
MKPVGIPRKTHPMRRAARMWSNLATITPSPHHSPQPIRNPQLQLIPLNSTYFHLVPLPAPILIVAARFVFDREAHDVHFNQESEPQLSRDA